MLCLCVCVCVCVCDYICSLVYNIYKSENPSTESEENERERESEMKKAFSLPVFTLKVSEVYIRLLIKIDVHPILAASV